jgi:hypothetical protein
MADIEDFFIAEARVSRRALARFAELGAGDVDRVADDLGFGPLVSFVEAEEILGALEDDDASEDDEDDAEDE